MVISTVKPSAVEAVLPNAGVNATPTTDVDGTDVDVDGAVVVVDGTTVVVVGDTHGSKNEGAKAKPPRKTSGAATIDNRPAEVRPQRVTITPAINKNKPATTTNDELPVAGRLHTSPANTTTPSEWDPIRCCLGANTLYLKIKFDVPRPPTWRLRQEPDLLPTV